MAWERQWLTGVGFFSGRGAGVLRLRTPRTNRVIVGTTYSSQTVSSSTVVAGEKLKTPLSKVAYHVVGSRVSEMSHARLFRPGRMPASCRSWTPYDSTPPATRIKKPPVQAKKRLRLM